MGERERERPRRIRVLTAEKNDCSVGEVVGEWRGCHDETGDLGDCVCEAVDEDVDVRVGDVGWKCEDDIVVTV